MMTEPKAILCGSQTQREKVSIYAVCVWKSKLALSFSVRNLGVIVDANITMQDHMSNTVRGCFNYMHSLGKLHPFLSVKAANATAVSTVLSRPDYAETVACVRFPFNSLNVFASPKQSRSTCYSRTEREHIIPFLKELHWLPVRM